MESIFSKKNIPMVVMNISTIVIVAIMIVVSGAAAKPSEVETNQSFSSGVLSYQGTLTDSQGNPLTGLYEMVFRVYPSISGGAVLWTESRMGENAVLVSNGLFSVMLGSLVPIPESIWEQTELYLGVQIGNDEEMEPREKLMMVPSAGRADVAELAMTVPDGSIALSKLGEQPYYFYGSLATPTEWMADVIFNGNYARFCEAIGRNYSRAETLTAHYTEYPSHNRGKGNGYFYQNWYYVGQRINEVDAHSYGNGDPNDYYNVWKINGQDYPYTSDSWTYERSAIIWCKP